ncbi:glycerol kinase [Dacryopinax primogenitus]|uniref:glycerol kinase n=1 Tax=Dacryopinax primogenitus (strain DJM 731) TaxID=1858805 RepID=M5FZA8_DACPD|nr:glycerol kinase [Dacryopinax primogenitus]EJU03381.1 glycerol kinase [Dacryopinax primogenitus]
MSQQEEFVGAIDCGTTSARFLVFNDVAEVIAEAQEEFPQYYPHPGWHEHEPDEIQEVVERCVEEAVENLEAKGHTAKSIKAIGITNQRETTVAWDRITGKALCKAIVWDDSRTRGVIHTLERRLKEKGIRVHDDHHINSVDDLVTITGTPLSTYFSAVKLTWMMEHHEEVKKAHEEDRLLFGTVDSWLVYNLTGGVKSGIHIIDVTNASRTLLFDIRKLQWSPALLEFFGFKENILPRIVSSSEVYAEMADGPLKGVPIAGIVGDQQAALVGNKCLEPGQAKNTYGTGAFLLWNTGEEVVKSDHGLITTVAYQPGPNAKPIYALEGSISTCGSSIKWLRDSMRLIEKASDMDKLARKVEDTGGVYFVPAFSGLLAPYWDSAAGGLLIGLSAYTTPEHIARATLEAIAYQTKAVLEAMAQDHGADLEHLKVDGGVTNSEMAMQIQADIGGFEVIRPLMRESTALGSALLAGSAVGLFGWDVRRPETLNRVNTQGNQTFNPKISTEERARMWVAWNRAVERSRGWEGDDE